VLTGADGATSVATVRVQVNSISPPLILGEQVSTRFETALTIDALANDFGGSNREGERYPIVPESLVIETPSGAEVTMYADASGTWTVVDARIEFVPADDYWGNTRVSYRFRDSVRQRSSRGTVSMTVTPNPEAADDAATGYLDQVVTVGVTVNDFTPPGTTIDRVSLVAANGNGTVSIVQAGVGTWTYQGLNVVFTPVAGFLGSASAPYRIVNNRFHTADATVTVTVAPLPEVDAVDDTVDGFFGSLRPAVDIDVLANDSSETGAVLDPSTLALLSDVGEPVSELVVDGEGTWRVVDGHLEFTPVAAFGGAATAAYAVANDLGSAGQATATVNVRWAKIKARPDFAWIGFGDVAVVDVAGNDTATGAPVDENSTTLIGPDGESTQSYETPQGVWSVVDGSVHFEPHRPFRGIAIAPYLVDNGITTGVGYVVVLVTSFSLG